MWEKTLTYNFCMGRRGLGVMDWYTGTGLYLTSNIFLFLRFISISSTFLTKFKIWFFRNNALSFSCRVGTFRSGSVTYSSDRNHQSRRYYLHIYSWEKGGSRAGLNLNQWLHLKVARVLYSCSGSKDLNYVSLYIRQVTLHSISLWAGYLKFLWIHALFFYVFHWL